MSCSVCLNIEPNTVQIYNDCIIECLEKIKIHYMKFKKQLEEKEFVIKRLNEENCKLKLAIDNNAQTETKYGKKRRMAGAKNDSTEIRCADIFASQDISTDDLNMALNDENEFGMSFVNSSPVKSAQQLVVKREPMKVITAPVHNDPSKKGASNNNHQPHQNVKRKEYQNAENAENKKKSGWISKENEIKRSTIGSFHKHSIWNQRHVKQEHKTPPNLLKSGRLRQTRLQLDISKSSPTGESTFCEEAIDASPNSDSTFKKTNSSRQWLLRNVSNRNNKSDNESVFETSVTSPDKSSSMVASQKSEHKALETSSVVMLTPATQDIIFLDDSCESFNIESMDLLRDLMNPSETHLNNLRRMESNRIKLLQKTVREPLEYHAKACSDFDRRYKLGSTYKNENDTTYATNAGKDDLDVDSLKDNLSDTFSSQENNTFKQNSSLNASKGEKQGSLRRQQTFNVDCSECQAYIKYLGGRLSDEEIEHHIRNCSKHKKRTDINLTPDGFWDPTIKPLDKDDPRNLTLVDTRFVGKEMRH